ncbi:MAG TPA: hypothetical protein VD768_02440 [Sphingomicrobium sp.]|nr:hypothetical protein [Sphingomicrobium sp.]
MRALILAAGAALTLSACGGGGGETAENNTLAVETLDANNLVVSDPAALNGTATLDANATGNADSANLVAEDLTTNSPDANLSNGL